jgi:hypothetical protein
MNIKWYPLIQDSVIGIPALTLAIYCFSIMKKTAGNYALLIGMYCLASVTASCVGLLRGYKLIVLPVSQISIFIFFEYLFFALCIYKSLRTLVLKRIIIFCSILVPIMLFITEDIANRYIDIQITAENLIVLALLSFYYIETFNIPPLKPLDKDPVYWIVNGGIIYFAGTTPMYAYMIRKPNIISSEHFYLLMSINMILFLVLLCFLVKAVNLITRISTQIPTGSKIGNMSLKSTVKAYS